jgi:hypothetical protein
MIKNATTFGGVITKNVLIERNNNVKVGIFVTISAVATTAQIGFRHTIVTTLTKSVTGGKIVKVCPF